MQSPSFELDTAIVVHLDATIQYAAPVRQQPESKYRLFFPLFELLGFLHTLPDWLWTIGIEEALLFVPANINITLVKPYH